MTGQLGPMEDRIDILLATYNGERFLAEQLDSIVAQTHKNWRIIVRDDGSSDGTLEILEIYKSRLGRKFEIIEDDKGNLGFVSNFSTLMEASTAPYVALCDQDDVWLPEKLELSLAKMDELEREHGVNMPLLVFTDLVLVDESLQVIHPSFWRYRGLKPERCNSFSRLLVINVVTGCASLLNRSLIEKVKPVPGRVQAHDWWVALVAAAWGSAAYVPESCVLYRQHGENIFGAGNAHVFNLPKRGLRLLKNYARKRDLFAEAFEQANTFQQRYANYLLESHTEALVTFSKIPDQNIFQRIGSSTRCCCWPDGLLRKIVFALTSRRSRHSPAPSNQMANPPPRHL